MEELFTRNGAAYAGKYFLDGKGRPRYIRTLACPRCGGAGTVGTKETPLYTAAQLQTLDARAAKARAARERKKSEKREAAKIGFWELHGAMIAEAEQYPASGFLADICRQARSDGFLSARQIEAARNALASAPAVQKAADARKAAEEKAKKEFWEEFGEDVAEAEQYAPDSEFLRSVCRQARENGSLSPRQAAVLRKIIRKIRKKEGRT